MHSKFRTKGRYQDNFAISSEVESTLIMKYICIIVLLSSCLISSQARPGIRRAKPENIDENELQNGFLAKINHYYDKCIIEIFLNYSIIKHPTLLFYYRLL